MRVKIDFGRILPGLLLAVAGLIILVILVLVAVVAFLFSFISGFGGVAAAAVALLLVPAVLIAAGVVTVFTGVSWWGEGGGGWFHTVAARRATKDVLRVGERAGEVIAVIIAIIILLFFYENQLRGAAFFAPSFGGTAEFFFYGPLAVGTGLSLVRAIYGRRNAIRPLDCLNALFLAVASYWLLTSFPFDFAKFGEMFPSQIQFIFGWLTDDIGRLLLTLGVAISTINMIYTAVLYSAVRGQLRRPMEPLPWNPWR